jgi:hypothetical protein
MIYYSQCDPKWANVPYGKGKSSICEGGCGITSIAMAIATLKNDGSITPKVLSDRYGDKYHTYGTDWSLLPVAAQNYGLKSQVIGKDFNAAKSTLQNGGIVIASFGTGAFTSQGHFMVIRAVSEDGKKFYIADPYNNNHSGAYTTSYLLSPGNLSNMWSYNK